MLKLIIFDCFDNFSLSPMKVAHPLITESPWQHSGQTSSMHKWFNFGQLRVNFPRKISHPLEGQFHDELIIATLLTFPKT